jgi:hypothetical protein
VIFIRPFVEVERDSIDNKQVVQQVRSLAKSITDVCNCIILISEPDAICEFVSDTRENYIYVDEMTSKETKALLMSRKAFLKEEEYEKCDKIGGHATHLIDLLKGYAMTESIDVCIEIKDKLCT